MSLEPTARINASERTADAPLGRGEKAVCCIAVLILSALVVGGPFEQLLLGWLYYPARLVLNLSGPLGLALVVTALIGVLLYRNARVAQRTDDAPDFSPPHSRRRLVLLSIWLLLASSAAVGGGQQLRSLMSRKNTNGHTRRTIGPLSGAIETARDEARRSQVKNNLKQIGLATHNALETGYAVPGGTMDQNGVLLHGWAISLAYYMTFTSQGIDWSQPWNKSPNDRLYRCALPEFINPSMPGPAFDADGFGLSHVAGNMHVLPMQIVENPRADQRMGGIAWVKNSPIYAGGSHTVLIGTIGEQPRPWGHPANLRDPLAALNHSPEGFGGPPGWNGAMFLMCDGSVRFVGNNTAPEVLRAMSGSQ